jgi:hypothetical protein
MDDNSQTAAGQMDAPDGRPDMPQIQFEIWSGKDFTNTVGLNEAVRGNQPNQDR